MDTSEQEQTISLLEQVKILSESRNEPLINLFIERTKREITTTYLKVPEYKEDYDNVLVDMVVIKVNRYGTEGLKSQSNSGASETYLEDYPKSILDQLDAFKKKVHFA